MTDLLVRLHRPKADTIEISDLLEEARTGKYELPDFQRDLQWDKEDRIKLFDSIYRGFPIGDIMFWEPDEPRQGVVRFGPFSPAKRQQSPWLIVDGQQRLATLFGCLLLPELQEAEQLDKWAEWRFAFNVDTGRIVELPRAAGAELLPLPIAIDTSRYLKWARGLPEERREERTQAGDDFSKALRTYRIPFYVIRTKDRKLLQVVFERVNNTGKSMKRTDVFNALFPSDDRVRLDEIVQDLETTGFGRLQPDWLLQAVKAMVGMDPVLEFSAELRRMDEEDESLGTPGATRDALEKIHPRLRRAAKAAIVLLQQAGIQRVEALPYALALPPLMQFFDKFPGPWSRDVTKELKRLVWLVAAGGGRQQHRSTYLRAAARLIRSAKLTEEAVSSLVGYSEVDLNSVHGALLQAHHDWRSGATRLLALALFQLKPLELETGEAIPVWDVLPTKGDELFRRIWARNVDPLVSSSANRIISLAPRRGGASSTLARLAGNVVFPIAEQVLASQAITPKAWAALQNGEPSVFLKLRAARLAEVVEHFLRERLSLEPGSDLLKAPKEYPFPVSS